MALRLQKHFTQRGHIGTSNWHKISSLFLPLSVCTHLFSFPRKNNSPNYFYSRQTENPQIVSQTHSRCLILGFHCIQLSILVQFHFYFYLPPSSSLMCPTQKQPMFSLLFQHLLGELGQMNPYKHTHASTRVPIHSCTRRTLMCNRPASSDLNQKYTRKTP